MVELVCTMHYLCALELQFNSWFRRHIMTSANHSLRMPRGSSHRVYFHLRLHAKPMFLQHTYTFEESERGAPSIVCRAMIVSIVRNPSMRSRNIWFLCVHVEHIYDLNSRVHEWSILNVSLAKYWYDNHNISYCDSNRKFKHFQVWQSRSSKIPFNFNYTLKPTFWCHCSLDKQHNKSPIEQYR